MLTWVFDAATVNQGFASLACIPGGAPALELPSVAEARSIDTGVLPARVDFHFTEFTEVALQTVTFK